MKEYWRLFTQGFFDGSSNAFRQAPERFFDDRLKEEIYDTGTACGQLWGQMRGQR